MQRFFLLIFIFLLFPWFLPGQEKPFPLGPLLTTVREKRISWRPDWALTIPPDGFTLVSGQPAAITLILQEPEKEDQPYRVRWDPQGRLQEFPALIQGRLVQVQADYSQNLQGLTITGSEQSWEIDFIGKDLPQSLARIIQEGTGYFVALGYTAETWYDLEGTPLAHFTFRFRDSLRFLTSRYDEEETVETYHYDSFGHISEIQNPEGIFSALYSQEHRPRYWKRPAPNPQNYTLQWNEQGLLLRISSTEGLDLRYEYTLDSQGNWTERREIRMEPQLGGLSPVPGGIIKRLITYKK